MVGIGLAAGRALVEQIENPDSTPPVLTLPVELVVRASCGVTRERIRRWPAELTRRHVTSSETFSTTRREVQ